MQLTQHLSDLEWEVNLQDSIEQVLFKMNDLYSKQLPVVDHDQYIGLIREEILLEIEDSSLPLAALRYHIQPIFIMEEQHPYDALQLFANQQIQLLPVTNNASEYLGTLTQDIVIQLLNDQFGKQDGAILVLEMPPKDYSLAYLARIIEVEDAQIVHTTSRTLETEGVLEVTFQLNTQHIASIVASLSNHGYTIKKLYKHAVDDLDIQNRYSHLMNYLNL